MEVICLETEAFYALVEEVVKRLREKENEGQDKWIDGDEAMRLLRIKSKTTLQKLRDEGKYASPSPKRRSSFTTGIPSWNTLNKMPKEPFSYGNIRTIFERL